MDLILHIGMPKTGTTSLQENLLAHNPYYIGKCKKKRYLKSRSNALKPLKEMAVEFDLFSSKGLDKRLNDWFQRINGYANYKNGVPSLSISKEELTEWPSQGYRDKRPVGLVSKNAGARERPIPIAAFLREILVPFWSHWGSVRVAITFREQSSYLASLYSQASDRLREAGQSDFQRQVEDLIHHEDPSINWHSIVQDLEWAVGKENVEVFFFEQMKNIEFWNQFARFMGISEEMIPDLSHVLGKKENVRNETQQETWEIRPYKYSRRTDLLKERLKSLI